MSIDSPTPQPALFRYAGTVTRDQFALVQRMLLPWWGSMSVTALWIVIGAQVLEVLDRDMTDSPVQGVLTGLLLAAPMIALVWGLTTFAQHRQWRRAEATQKDITGSIGEAGVEWNTPMTTATFPWSKLIKVRQHPEMLLIFYSSNCAFYVPKRFFATETAWGEANALALRQLRSKP